MKHSFITGLCLVLLIAVLPGRSNAQSIDSLKARYDNELLHSYNGYMSKGQNGERIRFGELTNEFRPSPEGFKLYEEAKRHRTTGIVFASAALACIFSGAVIEHNGNRGLATGLLIGGLSFDIVSIVSSVKAQKKFSRAVWIRNRDVLFSSK